MIKFFKKLSCGNLPQINKVWAKDNIKWLSLILKEKPNPNIEKFNSSSFYTDDDLSIYYSSEISSIKSFLHLNNQKIDIIWTKDLRDVKTLPLIVENPIESFVKIKGNENFEIHISNSIRKIPERVLYNIALNMVEILFMHKKINQYRGDDEEELLILAALYLGLGPYIVEGFEFSETSSESGYQTRVIFRAPISRNFLAYILVQLEIFADNQNSLLIKHNSFEKFRLCYEYWRKADSSKNH